MKQDAPNTITLLATAHIEGRLDLLPRLFTLIDEQRRQAPGLTFLLDLGDSCAADCSICRMTEGRAPFLVMDSMGYDGAVIGGPEAAPIPPSSLKRLLDQLVMPVFIWNKQRDLTRGVTFTVAPGRTPADNGGERPMLCFDRTLRELPAANDLPTLPNVAQGQLAVIAVNWPTWTIKAAQFLQATPDIPADPTISAIVEMVESEAQLFAQQQGGHHESA